MLSGNTASTSLLLKVLLLVLIHVTSNNMFDLIHFQAKSNFSIELLKKKKKHKMYLEVHFKTQMAINITWREEKK